MARLELLIGLFAIPVILIVGWNELAAIAEQRRVNAWQLLTTNAKGNAGKTAALEYLNQNHYCIPWTELCLQNKESLVKIHLPKDSFIEEANLPGANMYNADLYGVSLTGVDLSGANLRVANLKEADLRWGNLSNVSLAEANLSSADLFDTDLSSADLRSVVGLSQGQLNKACVTRGLAPINLPNGLTAPTKACLPRLRD
ncbi:pentapeptide repeat-containing protein [Pelagibius sp. Alg239-R121]|uniref:pentapeptide repeat-containing protein n=1 Tax=Pelagibius sp. Alg239-R121 TaxID=2993448 RepID=UPI0024A772F1|nr:pentapeptide repeat-containing protein [Pelagibius sp. Alg239-R121]